MHSDFFIAYRMNKQERGGFSSTDGDENSVKKRSAFMHVLVVAAVSCVVALVITFIVKGFAAALLVATVFVVAGGVQVQLEKQRAHGQSIRDRFASGFILAAVTAAFFSLLSVGFSHISIRLVLLAFSASLLPQVVLLLWPLFHAVNDRPVQVWSYTAEVPHWKSTVFLNSIPVHFIVLLKEGTIRREIGFRAPVTMKLGLIFYHMVQEQNKVAGQQIPLKNNNDSPLLWIFYRKNAAGWRINLNPDGSLPENNIKANTTIVALQVTPEELQQLTHPSINPTNQSA